MAKNRIMVRPDGPLIVEGDLRLQDADENLLEENDTLVLCRCGLSARKPYCDGSHKQAGFQAGQAFSDERAEDISGVDGQLVITVKADAMLVVNGPVEIISRDGSSHTSRTRAALCRCGHSARKPFCDVSHMKCSFKG